MRARNFAHCAQMVEALFQTEISQIIGTDFVAQESGKLLVLLDECVPAVRPKNMMAVLHLFKCRIELASGLPVDPRAEDFGDLVGGQPPESDFTATLEDPVNRKGTFENEVPAVLDLTDRIKAAQIHGRALTFGELRTEDQGPVIETFPNGVGGEAVRCRL